MDPARALVLSLALVFIASTPKTGAEQSRGPSAATGGEAGALVALTPTDHPVLSREVSRLWFVPDSVMVRVEAASVGLFAGAMTLADKGRYDEALPMLLQAAARPGPLRDYAAYYAAMAQLRLGRPTEARRGFSALLDRQPVGYLVEAAALGEAECAEALHDYLGAAEIYDGLVKTSTVPEELLVRLGAAARIAGDRDKAANAFAHVYYEFPLSPLAVAAGMELEELEGLRPAAPGSERYRREFGRAEQLYGAGRYTDAQTAFEALRSGAEGDDLELADLRLAQSDYYLKRPATARDRLRPYLNRARRQAEVLYFYALSARDLRRRGEYVTTMRRLVDEFPGERWAEEALNHLGTSFIARGQGAEGDRAFRELYEKYPKGKYAERAAWTVGWRSYRRGRYAETPDYFERAAADFPRSDYRPAWLYWSGRAHEHLKQQAIAEERYMLAAADYLNSYYGRLAVERLAGRTPPPRVVGDEPTALPAPPPNAPLVRTLLGLSRYTEALGELRYAQQAWGDSPAIQATIAWVYRQQGQSRSGMEQFKLLRGSITLTRRAYPQFMAAGGEQMPRELLALIFPLSYWDLIQEHSARNDLDPYLVAALTAQESTFVPDINSAAGAVGLMQLMPATARGVAGRLRMSYSSRLLTTPESNIRMGTAFLADRLREFGRVHLALASYNAGGGNVRRWMRERPGLLEPEEFIEDIPYSETRNYLKRLLGTAEDYRRLYGQ